MYFLRLLHATCLGCFEKFKTMQFLFQKEKKQKNQANKAKCYTAVCSTWNAGLYFLLGTRKVIIFSFTVIKSLFPSSSQQFPCKYKLPNAKTR